MFLVQLVLNEKRDRLNTLKLSECVKRSSSSNLSSLDAISSIQHTEPHQANISPCNQYQLLSSVSTN